MTSCAKPNGKKGAESMTKSSAPWRAPGYFLGLFLLMANASPAASAVKYGIIYGAPILEK